ncbi:MAG: hypothetical protein EPN30_10400 [Actinomycetota bacterium]|nr:MAG: hypothetical protein EPN30_10400 [Actinomycetota bacterium]
MPLGNEDVSPGGLLAEAPPLSGFRIRQLELPKSDPTWRFALAANPASPGFLLELSAKNGDVGSASVGEIQHLGYRLAEMKDALEKVLPHVVSAGGNAGSHVETLKGPSRALIQMALLDLVARSRQVAAHELLGGLERNSVRVTRILSLKAPEEMARIASSHVNEGYRDLKIKLDNKDSDLDFERVSAIRAAVGSEVNLTVDANQSYSAEGALSISKRIAQFRIEVFEQPVPQDDIEGMRYLRERSPIPIEADEAANSVERVAELIRMKAVHGVSIKIPKLGGIDKAIQVVQMCSDAGLQVRIGAHVGSRLLSAAALQLAVVIPDLVEPAELAEFERLEGDPVTGLVIEAGKIGLPAGPGYGVSVSPAF